MKHFIAALFTVTMLTTPASAFSSSIDLPILTFPETVVVSTRDCADPSQVSGPDCATSE